MNEAVEPKEAGEEEVAELLAFDIAWNVGGFHDETDDMASIDHGYS